MTSTVTPHREPEPTPDPTVVTIATRAMLAQAVVLSRSLRRHQPSWSLEVVLIGSPVGGPMEQELTVLSVQDQLGLNPEELLAYHTEDELITMLVPRVLQARIRDHRGPMIHLPVTAWVLGELTTLSKPLTERPVLLAPRASHYPPDDGLEPSPHQLTQTGRIATNLIGVDGSPAAGAFLGWWIQRLDEAMGALDGSSRGHRRTRRYWVYFSLELACTRADSAILEDPGSNLSAWNVFEHTLDGAIGSTLIDGRWPLRMMDLAGFDPEHPFRLRPSSSRVRISQVPELRALITAYSAELLRAGWSDAVHRRDGGQRLANGLVFDDKLQALLAIAHTLGVQLESPLSPAGTSAFMDWLRGPAVHGGPAGVNRYVLHRVTRERPDVVAEFPDLDGEGGAQLVAWCYSSGQREMDLPEPLMPQHEPVAKPDAGSAAPSSLSPPADAISAGEPPAAAVVDDSPLGVRVSGYLGHALGLGAAARGYARALAAVGVTVSSVTASLDHLRPAVQLGADYGRHSYAEVLGAGGHAFELICVNPDELPEFVDRLGSSYFQGKRIGVWGWETNTIPTRWARAFELVDEIWVYSKFVAENLAAVSEVPVMALPPPVQAPVPAASPLRLGVPEGFLFLFAFDYSSTVQRKNPVGLIEAFKLAFAPGDGPRLLIKTINGPLLPLSEEEVLWAADGRPDIHVIDCSLTGEQRDALMSACDCYVSLHRSEGFGLTLAEAMAIGKPVIGTGYSGNVDFMNAGNSFLVDYELTRVGAECQIYPADGEWAQPNIEHAARLMRHVYDDPDHAARTGAQAREDISRSLSIETTGTAMRHRLQELAEPGHKRRSPLRSPAIT